MSYLLGVDMGTSGCKVVAINEQGKIISNGSKTYPTSYPKSGWAEQNPQDWYEATCKSIRECLKKIDINPNRIVGLSIDGPAHNVALMDGRGEIIYPTIHWSDLRSVKQCNTLQQEFGDLIYKTTWQKVNPSWTLSQLLWLKESEPEVWSKLRKIQVTKDYIRFRFTDTYQTDAYDAVGTQLYDVNNSCWSEELINILEFDHRNFPEVVEATAISGGINKITAENTGLLKGTPVAVGSGDSVIEAFGIGAIDPGQCIIKIASAANVNLVCVEPFPSFNTITYPYPVGGHWFSITATNSGASTMRWFRDTFYREENQKAKADGISVYQLIGRQSAGTPPGCEGLIFHPYLMGERTPFWDPYLRGDFLGINTRHRRNHFARAILEGVAFSIRDCFEVVSNLGQSVTEIHIVGGGSKSPLWCQIVADILGRELHKPFIEDAAFGAAVLAGIASGYFSDWHDAIRSNRNMLESITPDPDTHNLYEEYFAIYRESVPDITKHSHKLAKIAVKSNTQKTIKIE